jgi:septum formation protein
MNLKKYNLLLASQSPRRRQLLSEAGFQFSVRPTDADETLPPQYPPEKAAEYLAALKAEAGREWLTTGQILLAADTVVILAGVIFGKPTNYEDAFQMIQKLSGKTHEVITGVCLLSSEKKISFSESSKVTFEHLSEEEIDFYIQNYRPFDKAGSYGIQEWIGLCKIQKIEGTYANVMGLPMNRVYEALKNHF